LTTETDIVVVGGGIAALSAAAQAARLGHRCTVFTGPVAGGLLLSIESIEGLPDHPEGFPGYELCPMTQEEAMDAGAQFVSEDVALIASAGDLWRVRGDTAEVSAASVILAPGGRLRQLGVPGEERLYGKGVSHCASCDAPMLRGRPVAVVGGGDAACQEALTLVMHASEVHMLVRGTSLRARPGWRARVEAEPKIIRHFGTEVEEIAGDGGVQAVKLRGGESLPVEGVFVYPGVIPATAVLVGVVPLDPQGRIVVDEMLRTPVRGALAAGIARSRSSGQAAEAATDGIAAADAAHVYLGQGSWSSV
jgi:thioredoxin reductase (NADPH)